MKKLMAKLFRDEDGQAMTEYVILAGVIIVSLVGIWDMFQPALSAYYERIVTIVSLPIP